MSALQNTGRPMETDLCVDLLVFTDFCLLILSLEWSVHYGVGDKVDAKCIQQMMPHDF